MEEENLPIKLVSVQLSSDLSEFAYREIVQVILDDIASKLRLDEAAVVKITYYHGHTHRFYVWRAEEKLIFQEGFSSWQRSFTSIH